MDTPWEIVESGPADAPQTVLLLPGGMCSARSYAEVMTEPSLAGVHLIAVTMPGHAGAPAPEDFSAEHYVEITAELAKSRGVDAIVGFSMGAQVAFNMVVPARSPARRCCWGSACPRRTNHGSSAR
jgi:pimeloyl-ACP methyl ester carboxylesterase